MASAIATFGTVEEYCCAIVFLWTWLAIIDKAIKRSSFRKLELCGFLALLGLLSLLCYPAIARSFQDERVEHCRKNISAVAEALLSHRRQHEVLPASQVEGNDGSVQSWRVAILPYLATQVGMGTDNSEWEKLKHRFASTVFSGSRFGESASYFAVTGNRTAWNSLQKRQGKITDNPAETILILEELDRGFDWDQPRDLNFAEALELLSQPVGSRYVHLSSGKSGYFEKKNPNRNHEGVNAAFADGSVRFVPVPLPKEFATALLTADGSEEISSSDMKTLWKRELDYGKICSFSVFAFCCLLPGLRIRKRFR